MLILQLLYFGCGSGSSLGKGMEMEALVVDEQFGEGR